MKGFNINDIDFYKIFTSKENILNLKDICINNNSQFDNCDYEFLVSKMEEYEIYKSNFNFSLSYQQKNPTLFDLKRIFKSLYPQTDFEDYTQPQVEEMIQKIIMENHRVKSQKLESEINKLRGKFSEEELEYIDSIYILEKLIE